MLSRECLVEKCILHRCASTLSLQHCAGTKVKLNSTASRKRLDHVSGFEQRQQAEATQATLNVELVIIWPLLHVKQSHEGALM